MDVDAKQFDIDFGHFKEKIEELENASPPY